MSDAYNHWLADHTQLSWVLACAVRYSDRSHFSLSYSAEYPRDACEEAWSCMAEAQRMLGKFKLPPGRFGWSFQSARFLIGIRADGACLGLLTQPNPPADELEKLYADFNALP